MSSLIVDSAYAAKLLLQGDFGAHTTEAIIEPLQRAQGATVFPTRDVEQLRALTPDNLALVGQLLSLRSTPTACENVAWETGSMSDTSSGTSFGTSSGTSTGTSPDTSLEDLLHEVNAVDTKECLVPRLVGEVEEVAVRWMPFVSLFARLYEAHLVMG